MDRWHWEEPIRGYWYAICDAWESGRPVFAMVVRAVLWIVVLPVTVLRLCAVCGAWLVRGAVWGMLAVLGAALLLNICLAVAHVLFYPLLH